MLATASFVRHLIANDPLPPPTPALYEYILAGNGVFLRAQRNGLSACIPLLPHTIHGLPTVMPYVTLTYPRIPLHIMTAVYAEALAAWNDQTGPKEALFHCAYDSEWSLTIPDQIRTYGSVHPSDPYVPSYSGCLVEIHSHHQMVPDFSSQDDEDEIGFRIFGVCGNFKIRPSIQFRVGIYGHFFPVPASLIVELPEDLHDALSLEEDHGGSHDHSQA